MSKKIQAREKLYKLEELIGKAHGGVGLRHVTKGKFQATEVPLPPKAEQLRIESLQARSSRARVLRLEVGTLIGQLRQSVLRAAFSDPLADNWRAKQSRTGIPARRQRCSSIITLTFSLCMSSTNLSITAGRIQPGGRRRGSGDRLCRPTSAGNNLCDQRQTDLSHRLGNQRPA